MPATFVQNERQMTQIQQAATSPVQHFHDKSISQLRGKTNVEPVQGYAWDIQMLTGNFEVCRNERLEKIKEK